jgi:hypothetical protein
MGPVFPLIFECSRANAEAGEIRRLSGQVQDWDQVVRAANRLGVAPLLSWSLTRACPESVPPRVLAELRDAFRESAKRHLILTTELLRVLALFRQAGIDAVPLKGPALAAQLYDPPALRPTSDLDVLINRADLPRAIHVAASNGYRFSHPNASMKFFEAGSEFQLTANHGVLLELHWHFAPALFNALRPSCAPDSLATASLGGCQIPVFRTEDLLPMLCVHGAKHCWCSLKWLCDVARLVESPDLDWDRVTARSEAMRLTRPLLLGVALARDLLSAAVPPEIVARIERDEIVCDLAASNRATLESEQRDGWRGRFLYTWQLLHWRDRSAFWASILFMPTVSDWEFMPIPAAPFATYYLVRPIRLAWEWALKRNRPC